MQQTRTMKPRGYFSESSLTTIFFSLLKASSSIHHAMHRKKPLFAKKFEKKERSFVRFASIILLTEAQLRALATKSLL